MTELGLQLDSVTRRFGDVLAVDRLTLDVPAGSFVTLLGPSGCGKSTTLSLIAGLEELDGGSIWLDGREITNLPPNDRRIAMVFQNYALYPHMTAYDNIAFGLRRQRLPQSTIRRRVSEMAEALSVSHLLGRRPGQLSGGQQQRIGLGRALVKEPRLFLLDEPFSNLDAALRHRMRTDVKRLHQTLGTTSVFVTHDQEEAMALSDLIAVMRDGRVAQFGRSMDIYRRPQDLFVATFVGKPPMGLVRGSLVSREGALRFVGQGLDLNLGSADSIGLMRGPHDHVTLGFRAEDLRVCPTTDHRTVSPHSFGASVGMVEPNGPNSFVELRAGDAVLIARTTVDLVRSGEDVIVEFTPDRCHMFGGEHGSRIAA